MKLPKVSIVIPVYNGTNYLSEAIDSALSQTYQNIEIIVVNDGSNDEGKTQDIALSYGNKIRYFNKEKNGGVATALNFALEKMDGEYFSWLSHDDLYMPNKIEEQINVLKANNTEIGIVYSGFTQHIEYTGADVLVEHSKQYSLSNMENGVFPVLFGLIHGCTLLIHKSYFEKAGNFNESLRTTQDYDMWFRMFEGQKLIYIPQALVLGRVHNDQGSKTIPEHYSERVQLYNDFILNITENEVKRIFGSKAKFLNIMEAKFLSWGFNENAGLCRSLFKECNLSAEDKDELQNNKLRINSLLKTISDEFYIFGAGNYGREVAYNLKCAGIDIKAYIDNNKNKHNMIVNGYKCIALEDINNKNAAIIVSVKDNSDILKQLTDNKFTNFILKCDLDKIIFDL